MSDLDIVRAWKDPDYRDRLTESARSQVPTHPAGILEVTDDAAQTVAGGYRHPLMPIFPREFFELRTTYFLTGCDVFPNG